MGFWIYLDSFGPVSSPNAAMATKNSPYFRFGLAVTHCGPCCGPLWPTGLRCALANCGLLIWPTVAYCGLLCPAVATVPCSATVAYYGLLWPTLAYCGQLWAALAYCGFLWFTVAYCSLLWPTVAYYGLLWATIAYQG